ncbi:MAG: uroporphyrinogen-III synthase [Acidobacteriaceae bacterium]
MADLLRAAGAEPVVIPTIELVEPNSLDPLDQAWERLATFHWLLFTSANAVEFLQRHLAGIGCMLCAGVPAGVKVAAIGAATARAVEAAGLRVDHVPRQAVAESLAEELLPYAVQSDGSPSRLLLLRAEEAREVLPDTLRAAGAEVTVAPVYRNVIPVESLAAIRGLFSARERWPDAIAFTSSSSVTNLLALLEAASLDLPQGVMRISIGPITSQTLRDVRLPPDGESAEASLAGLVAAVMEAWERREQA